MNLQLEIGKHYQLIRSTFLYQGILILQKSKVELIEVHADKSLTVLYLDKEGNPHNISGFNPSDLGTIS